MIRDINNLKVALVHDFLMQWGGAERILQAICEIFPYAEIFTIVADPWLCNKYFNGKKINTSFIQKFPFSPKKYKIYLPLMPKAIERFDFNGYDLVISDASAFAKGVITKKPTKHICYLHTPTRYLWHIPDYYIRTSIPFLLQPFFRLLMPYLKKWDKRASGRPDVIIANSYTIKKRTLEYYKRKVDGVVHPFVDLTKFFVKPSKPENYYLISGRLVPYKRFDIVIEAFNVLGYELHVVGVGYGERDLRKINCNPNTKFLGNVSDTILINEYKKAKAYIFPSLEDFGITPLESLACGRPVIAFGSGGVTETVIDNVGGLFFQEQTKESLISAIKIFENKTFNSATIQKTCLKFSKERFKKEIVGYINKTLKGATAKMVFADSPIRRENEF